MPSSEDRIQKRYFPNLSRGVYNLKNLPHHDWNGPAIRASASEQEGCDRFRVLGRHFCASCFCSFFPDFLLFLLLLFPIVKILPVDNIGTNSSKFPSLRWWWINQSINQSINQHRVCTWIKKSSYSKPWLVLTRKISIAWSQSVKRCQIQSRTRGWRNSPKET